MRGDTLYKLIKFLLNGAVQEIATSLVGLKRVKAHFTASQSLVPLLWKRDKGQWQ